MAHAELNTALDGLSGRTGNLVYKRYGDKTVVTKVPTFTSWSERQKQGRSGFAAASAWAVRVQGEPGLRDSYALWAEKMGLTIRSAAISDFLQQPAVRGICGDRYDGTAGRFLAVMSARKYKFATARVVIRDAAGALLEEGATVRSGAETWIYVTKRDLRGQGRVSIEGIGTDRLGREGRLVISLEL